MKNKTKPVRTVLRSKTQILETAEQILSGNMTNSDYLFGILKLFFLKMLMDYVEDYARQ
jgi:hypothetical protein